MIIIPEIQTVLLQPPRTGTTSVRDAVLGTYPQAFLLYRHMEADGIPFGYKHWRTVTQVRDPLSRLISVYRYMKDPKVKKRTNLDWIARMKAASNRPFVDWLSDPTIFTSSGLPTHSDFRPRDCVTWSYPEQVKSQKMWFCGGELLRQENIVNDAKRLLDVVIGHTNQSTAPLEEEYITAEVYRHLVEHMSWDINLYGENYYDNPYI